jgi:hypothetical protein
MLARKPPPAKKRPEKSGSKAVQMAAKMSLEIAMQCGLPEVLVFLALTEAYEIAICFSHKIAMSLL